MNRAEAELTVGWELIMIPGGKVAHVEETQNGVTRCGRTLPTATLLCEHCVHAAQVCRTCLRALKSDEGHGIP